jgi:hypothetical protein
LGLYFIRHHITQEITIEISTADIPTAMTAEFNSQQAG